MVKVRYEASYDAGVDFVSTTLTDKAFLDDYATQIGALRWDAEVTPAAACEGARTRLRMTVPTTGVPAAFKRFVTPTVDILETRQWEVGGTSGTVAVDAAVSTRAALIRGTLALIEADGGCRFSFDGDIAVNIRIVGDAAALLIRDLIRSVLGQQTKVMQRWINA